MSGWNADAAAGLEPGSMTLVEGSSFSISSRNGDITARDGPELVLRRPSRYFGAVGSGRAPGGCG